MANAVNIFNEELSKHAAVFLVYYRGHWCPFCIHYLTTLQALTPAMETLNVKPIIISAEPETPHLGTVRKQTGYNGVAISDPEHDLVNHLKEKGIIDVAISTNAIYAMRGYKHGMSQSAVLVIQSDGTVLFKWAIEPSVMNLGGAKDRPVLSEVWENVQAKLQGNEPTPKELSKHGIGEVVKWKLFG